MSDEINEEESSSNSNTPPPIPVPPVYPPPITKSESKDVSTESSFTTKVTDQVTEWAGVERLEGFKLSDVFSEALKKHSREEIEEYFTVGTPSTTPPIAAIETGWPKPWVFLRSFIAAAAIYFLFVQMWKDYENVNLVPGLIMVGSFAVPLSALIFFFEMNARKNVSLYHVIRLLFLGGAISLLASLFFYNQTDEMSLSSSLGASMAGLIEEPGKLLALLLVINIPKFKYTLNGLLFGAAVGTGFAAFESMGYALRAGLFSSSDMLDNIMVRGMLSPFSHIIWTAMCGAALWRVKGTQSFKTEMLANPKFYRVFFIAVILHMIWNSSLNLPIYSKYILLGIVGWIIVFALIQAGLKEIKAEKALSIPVG